MPTAAGTTARPATTRAPPPAPPRRRAYRHRGPPPRTATAGRTPHHHPPRPRTPCSPSRHRNRRHRKLRRRPRPRAPRPPPRPAPGRTRCSSRCSARGPWPPAPTRRPLRSRRTSPSARPAPTRPCGCATRWDCCTPRRISTSTRCSAPACSKGASAAAPPVSRCPTGPPRTTPRPPGSTRCCGTWARRSGGRRSGCGGSRAGGRCGATPRSPGSSATSWRSTESSPPRSASPTRCRTARRAPPPPVRRRTGRRSRRSPPGTRARRPRSARPGAARGIRCYGRCRSPGAGPPGSTCRTAGSRCRCATRSSTAPSSAGCTPGISPTPSTIRTTRRPPPTSTA